MKHVEELQKNLSDLYQSLKNGEVDCKTADSLANVAGKFINSVKLQLVYAELREEKPEIAFLDKNSGVKS
jgi:tyrosine-protein phosphatase YwqE